MFCLPPMMNEPSIAPPKIWFSIPPIINEPVPNVPPPSALIVLAVPPIITLYKAVVPSIFKLLPKMIEPLPLTISVGKEPVSVKNMLFLVS